MLQNVRRLSAGQPASRRRTGAFADTIAILAGFLSIRRPHVHSSGEHRGHTFHWTTRPLAGPVPVGIRGTSGFRRDAPQPPTPVAGEDAGAVSHFQGGSLPTDARLRRVVQGAGHPADQARRLVRGARCPGPAGGIPRSRINRCAVNPSEVAVLAASRLEAIEFCEWLE